MAQSVLAPMTVSPYCPSFCGHISAAESNGCTICATLTAMACWPTKWGWGRPSRSWRCLRRVPWPAGRISWLVRPASLPVWREEIARFFPQLECDVLKTGHDFTMRRDPVVWLASYTQLRKHKHLLDRVEFGYAVLDEGQFIKNPDAKVAQCLMFDSGAASSRHDRHAPGEPAARFVVDLPFSCCPGCWAPARRSRPCWGPIAPVL